MVLCEILTADKPDIQPNDWPENVKQLQNPTEKSSVAVSRLLAYIVSECLSPSVDGRPSALQLLAVVMKSDISSKGLERSESFWRVIATRADSKLASSIVTRFVSEYLPLLEQQTVFSILETTLIMSLTYKYCPEQITQCHCVLYNNLFKDEEGELVGSTAFHGITWLPKKEDEILRLALEDSRWPSAKELSHLAIAKNKTGLLPSALAALQGKRDLCVYLTGIEEQARTYISDIALNGERATVESQFISLREELQEHAAQEFDFMFNLLTQNISECISISPVRVSKAMVKMAQKGFSNMTRKLVEQGIDPSSPSIRGSRLETVLHIFAQRGDVSMVQFMLKSGVNVDARDNAGRTPLHWAAWSGQDGAVNALLSSGANVNATDVKGRTALYGAAGGGFMSVVSRLLFCNADITIRGGQDNETPVERARKNNHISVVNLFSENINS
ncbi:hypothetical protein ANO14919_079390 [Xylariales sp. No.14919]|nr:hypothetical protein ANO14919_079390 [Xylariales sp. No.14919]